MNGVSEYVGDVLAAIVDELAMDPADLGVRTLEVLRARSPELVRRGEESGEDPAAIAAVFMEILLASLSSEVTLQWKANESRSREHGRERAAQGVRLESLIDELAVYRRATIELISARIQDSPRRDEVVAYAQDHLEDVVERLTAASACGYLDHIVAENHGRQANILQSIGQARYVVGHIREACHQMSQGMSARGQIAMSFGAAVWQSGRDWRAVHRKADADLDARRHHDKTVVRRQAGVPN